MWVVFAVLAKCSHNFEPEYDIPEPIIKVPVTVVFLGTHKIFEEKFASDIKTKWFRDLSHEITQTTRNSTDFYISSEIIKVPALKYRFEFSFRSLPRNVSETFEDILTSLSRESGFVHGSRTVHPYPLEFVLKTLVDQYQVPGNVFFVYGSENRVFSYCEGVTKNEIKLNRTRSSCPNFNLNLDSAQSWSEQIKSAISQFGDWTSSESVMSYLSSCKDLERESRSASGKHQCGLNWVMQKNRIFFMDASSYANRSLSETFTNQKQDSATINERLSDSVSTFDQMCNKEKLVDDKFCKSLEEYIESLRRTEKSKDPGDMTYVYRFLTNISAIIMEGLKSYSVPDVPSFSTELPDRFIFYISQIHQNQKTHVNTSEIEEALSGYVIGGAKYSIRKEKVGLSMWPYLALPLADLKPVGSHLSVKWDAMREGLQDSPINHKLYSVGNETMRDIVANHVIFNEKKPILFNNVTSSFAFDSVSVSISNYTNFDPLPLLRSCLLHMYGLQPSKRWRSLSVVSLYSKHTELSLLSCDAAYRNTVRVELSKSKTKIAQRIKKVHEIIDFANSNQALELDNTMFGLQIQTITSYMQDVVDLISKSNFTTLPDALKQLKAARKSFSRYLKQMLQDAEEQMCQNAPVNLIVKPPSLLDKLDYYASMTSVVWLGALVSAFLAMVYTCARNMKRD